MPTGDVPQATRREWIGLGVLALPCMLYSMDLTVLNLAVPQLSADLRPSAAQLLWIIDIYGFLVAGLLVTMGTLGDRIGRRRLLLIGAAAFGVGSIVAALSTSAPMLIATRALLGIAGATVAPSTLSLIRNMFLDPTQRTFAIGVWVTSYSVGAVIGPLIGGAMLEHFWWGSVFLLALPVMGLLLVTGPLLLPEYRDPHAGRLDLISAALSLAAVLLIIYGLKRMAEHGLDWPPIVAILAGVAVGVAFVRRQRGLADPLIDLRLFQSSAFSASLLVYLFGTFMGFGAFVFIAQYFQMVLGLTPWRAGLWTIPWAGGFIVGSMISPMIVRRVRPAFVMSGGLALAAVGFVLLARVDATHGLPFIVAASIVMSLGLAPVFTLATDLVVGTAPPERAGAASAISETASEFGGALGIAILGSLGTAVYRREISAAILATVPPEAAEAARGTLGGALDAARQLPGQLGVMLLDTARAAFTEGLRATALTSAVIAIGAAILAALLLRHTRASSEREAD